MNRTSRGVLVEEGSVNKIRRSEGTSRVVLWPSRWAVNKTRNPKGHGGFA